jgi:hypothetical protein
VPVLVALALVQVLVRLLVRLLDRVQTHVLFPPPRPPSRTGLPGPVVAWASEAWAEQDHPNTSTLL